MKKLLAILLSALMLVTLLAACGTEEPSGESAAPASEAPESETPAEPVELTVWHYSLARQRRSPHAGDGRRRERKARGDGRNAYL